MHKAALIIILITLLSKVLGFGREIALSYYFGTSGISDAYIISLTVPGVLWGIIGVGIVTVFIPRLSFIDKETGDKGAFDFTNNFIVITSLLVTALILFCTIFTGPIVKLFAAGFSEDTYLLAINYTRIAIWGMYFTCLVAIFNALLQTRNSFIITSLISFPMNIIVLCSIVIASMYGGIFLAIGSVAGGFSQLLLILPFVKKLGFHFSFYFSVKDEMVTKTLVLAMPVILGASVNQLNVIIDKTIASTIAIGGISSLNYAFMLSSLLHTVIVTSIVTVIYPSLSRFALKKDLTRLRAVVSQSVSVIIIIFVPTSMMLMMFSTNLVNLVFGRGAFDSSSADMTSEALFYYSIGLVGVGLREILSRVFYAHKDMKTPMINGIFGVVLNITLNFIFVRYMSMGVGGLALATSISATVTTGLLFFALKKKIANFEYREYLILCVKVLLGSGLTAGFAWLLFNFLNGLVSIYWAMGLALLFGLIFYTTFLLLARIKELNDMIHLYMAKFVR